MRSLVLALAFVAACGNDTRRQRDAFLAAHPDSGVATPPPPPFEAPDAWETVRLASGVTFQQPVGFTFGLGGARILCDASTPGADSAVFPRDVAMSWPLMLTTRRGLVGQIAYTNGFTVDSTDIAEHGVSDPPAIRRGEGFLLLKGERRIFGATRHPDGCNIVWAARGFDVNADTLQLVMGTVRFGAAAP